MSVTAYQRIQSLLDQLDQEEKLDLIDELAGQVRHDTAPRPRHSDPLYGVLKGHTPEDLDLDAALAEIRSEWTKEWTDNGEWTDT
jgi:hypothetical protein